MLGQPLLHQRFIRRCQRRIIQLERSPNQNLPFLKS
jgi:hypothetical protein